MDTIYLTDITGTIGEWLDTAFDNEVPNKTIALLEKVYNLAVKELEKESVVYKYNEMLKGEYGEDISVIIKGYIEDDGSEWYCYNSANYGDSNAYETIEEAYNNACVYLKELF